jgi:hypothetical protein
MSSFSGIQENKIFEFDFHAEAVIETSSFRQDERMKRDDGRSLIERQ